MAKSKVAKKKSHESNVWYGFFMYPAAVSVALILVFVSYLDLTPLLQFLLGFIPVVGLIMLAQSKRPFVRTLKVLAVLAIIVLATLLIVLTPYMREGSSLYGPDYEELIPGNPFCIEEKLDCGDYNAMTSRLSKADCQQGYKSCYFFNDFLDNANTTHVNSS